jgi:hypothetical protein
VELRTRPEHPAHQVVAAHRAWVEQFLGQLAAASELLDPSTAAEQLHLMVKGGHRAGGQWPAHDGGSQRPGLSRRAAGWRTLN